MNSTCDPTNTSDRDERTAVRPAHHTNHATALLVSVFLALGFVASIAVCLGLEPIARLPLTTFMSFEYSEPDGEYSTRTTVDAKRNILRVERVHQEALANGGRGVVDGILKQTVYGAPWWGGASRPMITYDTSHQTVTKHSRAGDRTYSAEEFGGKGTQFYIALSGQIVGLPDFGLANAESSNWLVVVWRDVGPYMLLCAAPVTIWRLTTGVDSEAHALPLVGLQLVIVLLTLVLVIRTLRRRAIRTPKSVGVIALAYLTTTFFTNIVLMFVVL